MRHCKLELRIETLYMKVNLGDLSDLENVALRANFNNLTDLLHTSTTLDQPAKLDSLDLVLNLNQARTIPTLLDFDLLSECNST